MSTLKVNTILNASGGNDVTNLGSWKKLSTTTISSNVDNVTFTNSITDAFDTYNMYAIVFTQFQPTADSVEIRLRIQESGSTVTSSIYRFRVFSPDGNEGSNNADHLRFNKDALGNDTSGSDVICDVNGTIYMTGFMSNRRWRYQTQIMQGNNSQDNNFDFGGGGVNNTNATTGVVIYPESGQWASGTATLFGIAK
tara:strand:+ start:28 stop:615 length:588 start_codon:yes stop_codon:yes gene_type:complete